MRVIIIVGVLLLAGCASTQDAPCAAPRTLVSDGTGYSIGSDNKIVLYGQDGTAYGVAPSGPCP